jgi:hypothetical protein
MDNTTQLKSDRMKDIIFWLLLFIGNIFSFNFYWSLSSQELLELSWFHELIIFILWVLSLGITIGAYFQLKVKNWLNFVISIILGTPLLLVTTWAIYIFRSNALK